MAPAGGLGPVGGPQDHAEGSPARDLNAHPHYPTRGFNRRGRSGNDDVSRACWRPAPPGRRSRLSRDRSVHRRRGAPIPMSAHAPNSVAPNDARNALSVGTWWCRRPIASSGAWSASSQGEGSESPLFFIGQGAVLVLHEIVPSPRHGQCDFGSVSGCDSRPTLCAKTSVGWARSPMCASARARSARWG